MNQSLEYVNRSLIPMYTGTALIPRRRVAGVDEHRGVDFAVRTPCSAFLELGQLGLQPLARRLMVGLQPQGGTELLDGFLSSPPTA